MNNDTILLILTVVCGILDAGLIAAALIYEHFQNKKKLEKKKSTSTLYKMVISAVFIAIALVLKRFSVSIPLFGAENGMRVGLTGVFSSFPAILCGPLFGGMASAVLDIIGYVMNPTGPYNLIFTLTAFMAGTIRGFIWLFIRKANKKVLAAVSASMILAVGIAGVVNTVNLNKDGMIKGITASTEEMPGKWDLFDYEEQESVKKVTNDDGTVTEEVTVKKVVTGAKELYKGKKISFSGRLLRDLCKTKGEKTFNQTMATYGNLITIVLISASVLGLVFVAVSVLLSKKLGAKGDSFLNIFASIIGAELLETTINTEAIIALYAITLPFVLYWIPRVTESILVCIIQGYLISVLYGIYKTVPASIRNKIER